MDITDLLDNLYFVTLEPETEHTNLSLHLLNRESDHEIQFSLSEEQQVTLLRNLKRVLAAFHRKDE
jgi:hypothetical protein